MAKRAAAKRGDSAGGRQALGNLIVVWKNNVYFIPADRIGPPVGNVNATQLVQAIYANKSIGDNLITVGLRVPDDGLIKACANN